MRNDDEGEFRRGSLMPDAIHLMRDEHRPPDMLADFKRSPQHERGHPIRLIVAPGELAACKLTVVRIFDRYALSNEIASVRASSPHGDSQLGPGIDLGRVNLDRAAALIVRDDCRHAPQTVGSCAALVPAM